MQSGPEPRWGGGAALGTQNAQGTEDPSLQPGQPVQESLG